MGGRSRQPEPEPMRKLFERERDAFMASLERHSKTPGQSSAVYRLRRRIELASRVNGRSRVYLDTKYWIRLRDHVLGKDSNAGAAAIHAALTKSVQQGRVVIPATDSLISEVLQQDDRNSRDATAKLIDDLTRGIAIVGF